jgi:hypothetical protein
MKRTLPSGIAGVVLALFATAGTHAQTLLPEPAVVDLGDVFEGEVPHTTVIFTNKGEADFRIKEVRTSCGCTVATVTGPDGVGISPKPLSDQPILVLKPGETMQVGVELNTANQHGSVEKSVQVHNFDPTVPAVQVPVRARVTKAFSLTPEQLNLGSVAKRGLVEQELTIQSQSIGDWSIDGFETGIEGRPLPTGMHFEVLDKQGQARRVKMVFEGPRAVGPITARVRIKVSHERVKNIDFYVYGQVQSDVIFTTGESIPETINFDQMDPGSTVTRTLTITNHDPDTPYTITSLDIQAPKPEFFKTTLRTIEEGMRYEVDISADAAIAENFFRGNLVVRAQHPDLPSKTVPFHGWVRKAPAATPPAPATPAAGAANPK